MAITKIIRPLPDAPDSVTDSAPVFNTKANAYVSAQKNDFQPDVNAWAVEANQLEVDMNQIKTDVDGIVATIPSGTINDNTTATDGVWSSAKVTSELTTKWDDSSNKAIGVGQSWKDVTTTKNPNQQYTNGDKPIMVTIIGTSDNTSPYKTDIKLLVGGMIVAKAFTSERYARNTISCVIPPLATYTVARTSGKIEAWSELS